ncbi:hypothetical protein [Streptomyces sp. NPDC059631]|uniref:hypothetical protein n=1 Tax=unclassified Streptomyces TaxID=2593676 RepID=UPI003683CCFC
MSSTVEYGIASTSGEDIEPLGTSSIHKASRIIKDSKLQWPDIYLVERDGTSPWRPTIEK